LGVVCIKLVVQGKGGVDSTEGVVYMMKSRGLKTGPWEAPQKVYKDEKMLLHLTWKERYDKTRDVTALWSQYDLHFVGQNLGNTSY